MDNPYEIRSYEFRADEPGEKPTRTLRGEAAVFHVPTRYRTIYGDVEERIVPGAFSDTLRSDKQLMNWNHNPDIILASTRNNTLRLHEADTGLRFEADLADTTWGRDAHELVRSGTVTEMSFGFIVQKQEWDESDPKLLKRNIESVRLVEISPVGFAAYPTTSVEANGEKAVAEYRAAHPPKPVTDPPKPEPEPRAADITRERIEKKVIAEKIKEG